MRQMYMIILAAFFVQYRGFSQNLVPNPSFEDYIECPASSACIDLPMNILSVRDWYRPTKGSSDYFNSCAASISRVSVPANFAGYQPARTGDAYTGWCGYTTFFMREYVEAKLLAPLVAGHSYYVGYWISLGDTLSLAIDQMGALFTTDSLDDPTTWAPIVETPQVVSPVAYLYDDTDNWELVTGTFIADGGERWITIGNFTRDPDLNTDGIGLFSYYYLDDVCVLDLDSVFPGNIEIHDTLSCDDNELLLEGRQVWTTTCGMMAAPGLQE